MRRRIYTGISLVIIVGIVMAVWVRYTRVPQEVEAPTAKNSLYVSLGDSVASGLGLATPGDASGCGRTKEAYPYRLAADMGYQLVHLACSGATLSAGINAPQVAAGEQVSQRETLFQREPGLITLGIGANDVGWLSLLSRCFEVACGGAEDRAEYERLLSAFRDQLRVTLRAIDERYNRGPRLFVIGYYQVFPVAGRGCSDTADLSGDELIWGRELRSQLNQTISHTVEEADFGTYLEIDFSDHELCAAEPWVQGLADPAPYHANAAGQRAIAEQIKEALRKE